jgi:hypothetical protein
MPSTSPTNILRELCAIEFRTVASAGDVDLFGTINFNDPTVCNEGVTAKFGILSCRLEVTLSGGQMPLRFQLTQKQLVIAPVGDVLKDVKENTDREVSGSLEVGSKDFSPKISAGVSASQKESQTVSGKAHRPEYLLHVNLCGDSSHPAWQFRAVKEKDPIVGTLVDETFGKVMDFSNIPEIIVELKARIQDLHISLHGDKPRRLKALERFLSKEIEYVLSSYGPLARQKLGAD